MILYAPAIYITSGGSRGVQNPLSPPVFKYPIKWNNLVSVRPNYWNFMGYSRKKRWNQQSEPQTFIHMNPLSRNPGSAPDFDYLKPSSAGKIFYFCLYNFFFLFYFPYTSSSSKIPTLVSFSSQIKWFTWEELTKWLSEWQTGKTLLVYAIFGRRLVFQYHNRLTNRFLASSGKKVHNFTPDRRQL